MGTFVLSSLHLPLISSSRKPRKIDQAFTSFRNNHLRRSKKGVLISFAKSTGKHLPRILFFNKVATFLK